MSETPPSEPDPKQFGVLDRLPGPVATWFGSGLLPKAPGTWGSLASLPFAWAIIHVGGPVAIIAATILATVVGVWAGGAYARAIGRHDPGSVVIDEVAGQWLTTIPIAVLAAPGWLPWLIAFAAFRLFDITKPWPARRAERWPGGVGIMADDIVAGVYAAIVVALAFSFL